MQMTIGEAAKRAGCTAPTIRYYESIGLLAAIERTAKGRRSYDVPDVARLTFIRRARDFGLAIDQVRELLAASAAPATACAQARTIVEEHIKTIRARRAELRQLETSLQAIKTRCDVACGAGADCCTIFEDIAQAKDLGSSV
jgi:DNA-binding transcriptional MerR regulator